GISRDFRKGAGHRRPGHSRDRHARDRSFRHSLRWFSAAARNGSGAMIRVGLIGYGGIAQDALAALKAADNGASVEIVGVLVKAGRGDAARARLGALPVVESIDALLECRPKIVAEVAGQGAVAA